jgi:DNA-binding SARP family transcriptional activator
MPFAAKSSPPDPAYCTYRHPSLSQAVHNHSTIYTCWPGYLDTECLQAELLEQGRQVVWLRLEPEDSDPATFILSVFQALVKTNPAVGDDIYQQMRQSPGPVSGWAPHFHHLAQVLAEALGEKGVLVLEHIHKLTPLQPVLGLASAHLLPLLPDTVSSILITHERLPATGIPASSVPWGEKELQLPAQAGLELAHDYHLCLPDKTISQTLHLASGRIGALKALFSACDMFGEDFLLDIIQHGRDVKQMLTIILSRWLATLAEEEIQALALCSRTGYVHPDLLRPEIEIECPAPGPWLQSLVGGWRRLRCLWEEPLNSALHQQAYLNPSLCERFARRLAEVGAVEQSIRLSCSLDNFQDVVSTITHYADQWMEFGQWGLLESSLAKLPETIIDDYPQLLYARGEILALTGRGEHARRSFSRATTQFISQGDLPEACRSLLAESAVCASQSETDRAQLCALAARDLAQRAVLNTMQSWADWQLGRLALALDQIPEAQEYLLRALDNAGRDVEDPSAPVFQQLSAILQQLAASEEQIRVHHNAYLRAENALQEAARKLAQILNTPGRELPALFPGLEWARLPVVFKLASLDLEAQDRPRPASGNWRQRFYGFIERITSHNLSKEKPGSVTHASGLPMLQVPLALLSQVQHSPPPAPNPPPVQDAPPVRRQLLALPAPAMVQRVERPTLTLAATPEEPAHHTLVVYCLGSLRLFQAEKWIEAWPSRKAQQIFKYLLLHRNAIVSKDILMDTFWRDSDPEAARRNLHQAIYALRQILKNNGSDIQHILFENDGYCLNPELSLWVDYEEFQEHARIGQQLLRANLPDEALEEYIVAESLYQGDLLAEDLYEDWIQPPRQILLHLYITVASYLTEYHLSHGEYAAAITLCQRILARDSCQEEAHRNLMQCYIHLGQRHLAVRQYQLCLRSLKDELNLAPAEETRQLYRQVIASSKQPTH